MDRQESLRLADEFLSKKLGLSKDPVMKKAETDSIVSAVYQTTRILLAEIIQAAEPFNAFADTSEQQLGNNMSGLHIMHPELTMGTFRRLRQVTTVGNTSEVTPERLLMELEIKPTWLQENQKQPARELQKRDWVRIDFASGENPPCHARLTPTGVEEKDRLLGIKREL